MKFVRYGEANAEKPGLIDAGGNLRDLSDHISDIDGRMLSHAKIGQFGQIGPGNLARGKGGAKTWRLYWVCGQIHLHWIELS